MPILNDYTLTHKRQGSPDNHGVLKEPAAETDWVTIVQPEVETSDYISDSVDIGFTFNFAGNIGLTTFAVSPSGWAILKGNFDDADGGDPNVHYDNSIAYGALKCVLVFPWWDNLKTAALGTRTFINEDVLGNSYRVIDWHAYTNVAHTTSSYEKIRFQAILYESGNELEFRYSPLSTDATGTLTIADVPDNNDYFQLEDGQHNRVRFIFKTGTAAVLRDLDDTLDYKIVNVGISGARDGEDVRDILLDAISDTAAGSVDSGITLRMSAASTATTSITLTQTDDGITGHTTIIKSGSELTVTGFSGAIEGTSYTSSVPGTGSSAACGVRIVAAGSVTASGEVRDFFGSGGTPDGSAAPFDVDLRTPKYPDGTAISWPGHTGNDGPFSGAAFNFEFYHSVTTTNKFLSEETSYSTVKMLHVVVVEDGSSPKSHTSTPDEFRI